MSLNKNRTAHQSSWSLCSTYFLSVGAEILIRFLSTNDDWDFPLNMYTCLAYMILCLSVYPRLLPVFHTPPPHPLFLLPFPSFPYLPACLPVSLPPTPSPPSISFPSLPGAYLPPSLSLPTCLLPSLPAYLLLPASYIPYFPASLPPSVYIFLSFSLVFTDYRVICHESGLVFN